MSCTPYTHTSHPNNSPLSFSPLSLSFFCSSFVLFCLFFPWWRATAEPLPCPLPFLILLSGPGPYTAVTMATIAAETLGQAYLFSQKASAYFQSLATLCFAFCSGAERGRRGKKTHSLLSSLLVTLYGLLPGPCFAYKRTRRDERKSLQPGMLSPGQTQSQNIKKYVYLRNQGPPSEQAGCTVPPSSDVASYAVLCCAVLCSALLCQSKQTLPGREREGERLKAGIFYPAGCRDEWRGQDSLPCSSQPTCLCSATCSLLGKEKEKEGERKGGKSPVLSL